MLLNADLKLSTCISSDTALPDSSWCLHALSINSASLPVPRDISPLASPLPSQSAAHTHLDHDRIARHDSSTDGVDDVVEGPVPGHNGTHNTHWHPLHTRRLVKHLQTHRPEDTSQQQLLQRQQQVRQHGISASTTGSPCTAECVPCARPRLMVFWSTPRRPHTLGTAQTPHHDSRAPLAGLEHLLSIVDQPVELLSSDHNLTQHCLQWCLA